MTVVISGTTGITNDGGYTGDGVVFADTTPANTLVTTTGGNVGIGTSSPTNRLTVKQAADNAQASLGARIERAANDSALFLGYRDNSDSWQINATYGSTGAYKPITFLTSDTERARIDSSGNMSIGTADMGYRLHVANGPTRCSGNTGADYQLSSLPSGGADRQVFIAGVLGVSNGFTVRYVSGAMQYTMTGLASGTVSSSGGVLSASSDQNLKVADGEVMSALEKVQQLKPRYFYWKDKDGNANEEVGRQLGFFAQEVNAVIPEAAPTPKEETEGWGVYDRSIVATLTAAIQEQQAIITALTARVAALEGK